MQAPSPSDLFLIRSTGGPPATDLAGVNAALAEVGTRIWPLDLRGTPESVRTLLAKRTVEDKEAERIGAHFRFSRERMLHLIAEAGRRPHVVGGGALETFVISHGYRYPQLWVAEEGVDYSRFDRFHVNRAPDGTGVDEIMQMLWGRGLVIVRRKPDGETLELTLNCPSPEDGWIATYSGYEPHMGKVSGAEPGTKILVQVIGPPEWSMSYDWD